jgi:predicted regulator of Ras-like GTPase activity (Roadblock/LC7/MglB family)
MYKDTYASALQNALTEIGNVCTDVRTSFLFDKEATVIAGDAGTSEALLERVTGSLDGMLEKAETIGGLTSLVVEGDNGQIHISRINDMYLTVVASKNADMKYLKTVTRVLMPTVIKLLDDLMSTPAPLQQFPPPTTLLRPEKEESPEESVQLDVEEEPLPEPETPSNQLIVESFGGLLVRSDTVQISEHLIDQWKELLDEKELNLVEVESFNGKASQCKVKGVDDSKLENRAIIRIPDKLCETLNVKKGELVRVKPVTQ